MPDEPTLRAERARELVVRVLSAAGATPENARSVAEALVDAEALGQTGHGLRRLEAYAAQLRSGKVDGKAAPSAVRVRPAAALIDAAHGFAYPALDLAIAELAAIAPEHGVALAAIRRSHHAGAAGLFAERLADLGLVGLMLTNSPSAMAPWGGATPLYGTNPIAFSCPRPDAPPIVIDLSLSKVARGKVMAAKQKGEPIPEGWAFDARGRPTTDPDAALKGAMAPLGEAKGAALALMVELLAAGLGGAAFAFQQSSFLDADGPPPGAGQMLLAIDPAAFGGGSALARFEVLASAIESEPGARLPGASRRQARERVERKGLEIDAELLDSLERLARG